MPEPLRNLVAIAEYGTKFEVDVAVAALRDAGIAATASFDPAMNTAASFMASDRTFELLVHEDDAEVAVARLHDVVDSLPPEFRDDAHPPVRRPPSRRRRRQKRVVIVGLVLWLGMPAIVMAVVGLVQLVRG